MNRLSIVVPACGEQDSLELTLLSVLENRPASSEIVVACAADYDDPYGLDDEVRFVRMAGNQAPPWHRLANLGLSVSRGEIIHLLRPGVQVEDGWADSAIELLDYEVEVAAVSPLIYGPGQTAPITGVVLGRGGTRVEVDHGVAIRDAIGFAPTSRAGFFRRSILVQIGGWDERISPDLADVELGCAFAQIGCRCKVSRLCQVRSTIDSADIASGFAAGLANELIIRRYERIAEKHIRNSALLAAMKRLPRPNAVGYLLGRMAGRLKTTRRMKAITSSVNNSSSRLNIDPKSQAA